MTFDPDEGHLLRAFPDADVAHVIDRGQRGTLACLCIATVAVVATRWWRASGPRRRALLPSLAGGFGLLCFAALLVNDLVSGTRSQTLLWIAACSLVSVPVAFLAGLMRSRLARGGLADLFRGLGAMQIADLEVALRRALGDPSLVLAPDGDAAAEPGRATAPVERNGRRVATLVYDASLDDDPEMIEAATAATAVALENQQLLAEAEGQLAELKASRERIVGGRRRAPPARAQPARRRPAAARRDRAAPAPAAEPDRRRRVGRGARDDRERRADGFARGAARARGLHQAVLEHGLAAALGALANRSTVTTTVTCDVRERLPEAVELAAYFVASEALANVAKYSHAKHATVRVWRTNGHASIEIADDGVGAADTSRGSGLRGLADRVEALDGSLRVVSPAGAGTTVVAELPCGS